MNQSDNGFMTVVKQTLIVLAVASAVVLASLPVYYLVSLSGIFEWNLLKIALGALYGMLLGVGNFFAMAISLVLLTASAEDGKQGRSKAQSTYMLRQLVLFGLAVVGCLIPFLNSVAVLVSLALTQLAIAGYALIGKMFFAKNAPSSTAASEAVLSSNAPNEENKENDKEDAEQ